MASLSTAHPTLWDLTSSMDPNGQLAMVGEILNQTNPMLDDMPMMEGNLPTGHKSVIRSGLPGATWRKMYGYVQPNKSTRTPIIDNCGMLEAYGQADKALADLSGNAGAFRLSEDKAHIEGMSQEMASTLIYGNEGTEPEAFTGLSPRYNSASAENACNILNSGSTPDSTNNSSIWLIGWSPETVFGIYPKGSQAGLSVRDLGEVTVGDESNGYYQAYRSHYKWDCGLVVKDWRYAVRISLDAETLTKNASAGDDLIDLMSRAIDLLPSTGNCRPVFYANRFVRGFIRRQIMNKTVNSTLSIEQLTRPNGALIREPMFDGIPIRRCDAILNNETGI